VVAVARVGADDRHEPAAHELLEARILSPRWIRHGEAARTVRRTVLEHAPARLVAARPSGIRWGGGVP
jgi:hypothetical protein